MPIKIVGRVDLIDKKPNKKGKITRSKIIKKNLNLVKHESNNADQAAQNKRVRKYLEKNGFKNCHHCGKEVLFDNNVGAQDHNKATIDHIYSRLDIRRYLVKEKDNVVLSCHECNQRLCLKEQKEVFFDYRENIHIPDIIDFINKKETSMKEIKECNSDIFWMVYVQGTNAPTNRHCDYDTALKEAQRLTSKTGNIAYVMKSVCSVVESPKYIVKNMN